MVGSEWKNADGTVIEIVGEADGGWSYHFLRVRGLWTPSRKTKTISDLVLRRHYSRVGEGKDLE